MLAAAVEQRPQCIAVRQAGVAQVLDGGRCRDVTVATATATACRTGHVRVLLFLRRSSSRCSGSRSARLLAQGGLGVGVPLQQRLDDESLHHVQALGLDGGLRVRRQGHHARQPQRLQRAVPRLGGEQRAQRHDRGLAHGDADVAAAGNDEPQTSVAQCHRWSLVEDAHTQGQDTHSQPHMGTSNNTAQAQNRTA